MSALRGESDRQSSTITFDPAVLEVLQLGCAAHLRDVIKHATKMAVQRREGSQRPNEFVIVDDIRRGVGEIRKREEKIAQKKKDEENEKLLRALANRYVY